MVSTTRISQGRISEGQLWQVTMMLKELLKAMMSGLGTSIKGSTMKLRSQIQMVHANV